MSEKKLDQDKGLWAYKKEILGWILDGQEYKIQLPPEKCDKICLLIRKMLWMHTPPLNKYQELAGKLQHTSLGIPGGKRLFTPIDMTMTVDHTTIPLTPVL